MVLHDAVIACVISDASTHQRACREQYRLGFPVAALPTVVLLVLFCLVNMFVLLLLSLEFGRPKFLAEFGFAPCEKRPGYCPLRADREKKTGLRP